MAEKDLTAEWVSAGSIEAIDEGSAIKIVADPPIAVYKVNGEIFATADLCTHGASSLSEGYVEPDGTVECAAHMAQFCIKTGRALTLPATVDLATYSVRLDGEEIFVRTVAQ